ncbi:trypsin-5-like [Anopheles maculipalpis]|uniref:trypsin-5-like n=1 Tax=Anopheles maculipalpis TaxID=1496333 RepID=UPI002158A1DF|nr:trypsin-5-like [Anopheles maculipalpis]
MANKFTIILLQLSVVAVCVQANTWHSSRLIHPVRRFAPTSPYLAAKRIIGGFAIDITDAPYQVSVQRNKGHVCGGSILNRKWILSAAHCFDEESLAITTVRVGSSEHASGGTVMKLARIIPYPHHSSSTNNYDIALLELKDELTFSNKIQPVVLPEQDEPIVEGTMGIVSGWGLTLNEAESNDVLRATNVPTVNQQECNKAYQSYGGITKQMFCAGYKHGGMDTCRRDSGGPFIAEGKLIGVVSWGHECGAAGYPGVYARVASVREWIREHSGA